MHRRVLGNVHRKARFAHGGTAGNDDEVALLEAVRQTIQLDKPAGDARNLSVALRELANEVVRFGYDLLHWHERALRFSHGDVVNATLGGVERFVELLFVVHAVADDLAARADEHALRALGLNQLNVVLRVCRRGHKRHEVGQVRQPARKLQLAMALQLCGDRYEVNGVSGRANFPHRGKDCLVCGYVKIIVAQLLKANLERARVNEHAA